VGRLLAEGHEGRWVLIKDEEIIGIYDSEKAAMDEMRKRHPVPRPPLLVQQIQTREKLARVSSMRVVGPARRS
jgi:hypothetical protein